MAPRINPFIKHYKNIISSLLLGSAAAITYLLLLLIKGPISWLYFSFLFAYLWAFFSIVLYLFLYKGIGSHLEIGSKKSKTLFFYAHILCGFWLAINIPIRLPQASLALFSSSQLIKLVFLASAGVIAGILLYSISSFIVAKTTFAVNDQTVQRFRWWHYALPPILIWLVYLLAYWPGMMSADSMVQWQQVLDGRYNDHHPVFHTLTIWLVTRVIPSPASVAAAQILSLGCLVGVILSKFEKFGTPPVLLWIASFLFALTPVNGTMVNTLWKDIPYSASVLAFSFLVFLIARSKGMWIARKGNWLIFGIAALLVTQFRHNGLPIILGTAIILLLVYYRQWKPLILSFAVCAVLYLLIRGPLYQAIHVEKPSDLIEATTSLYSIAAQSAPGTAANEVFDSTPLFSAENVCDLQQRLYQAYGSNSTAQAAGFIQKSQNLARHLPKLFFYYYRCNRSLVWIIWDPYGEVRNTSHVEVLVDPNPFGIQHDSKIPFLRNVITDYVVTTSKDTSINWLVWRPALYLYLFLWVILVLTYKQKNLGILLAAAPILIQSIASTAINIAPNFRYHYAAYLLALAFWPLLFSNEPETSESLDEVSNVNRQITLENNA